MINKKFELAVILSLVHGHLLLEVKESDVKDLLEHVIGKKVEEPQMEKMAEKVCIYLLDKYPKIADAVKLTTTILPNYARYQSLINLCRMFHDIEPMARESRKQNVKVSITKKAHSQETVEA